MTEAYSLAANVQTFLLSTSKGWPGGKFEHLDSRKDRTLIECVLVSSIGPLCTGFDLINGILTKINLK